MPSIFLSSLNANFARQGKKAFFVFFGKRPGWHLICHLKPIGAEEANQQLPIPRGFRLAILLR